GSLNMRHGLLALGVLLGGTGLAVHAEYVRFVYSPGVVKKQDPQAAGAGQLPFGAGAMPGMMGQGAPGMIPGGAGGAAGLGMRGVGGRGGRGMRGMGGPPAGFGGMGPGGAGPGDGGPLMPGDPNMPIQIEEDIDPHAIRADIVVEFSAMKSVNPLG